MTGWQQLLNAYANGYFPMAMSRDDDELHWFNPEARGIIPLDAFHIPRSLARCMRKNPFRITTDTAFPQVIEACASEHDDTWINGPIVQLYCELWEQGFAHSVECWRDEKLVGGIYGVAIGGAFFGESMFSRVPNASRVALVHLVELLKQGGYTLFDTQFVNDHLKQFGVVEIPREEYLERLRAALLLSPRLRGGPRGVSQGAADYTPTLPSPASGGGIQACPTTLEKCPISNPSVDTAEFHLASLLRSNTRSVLAGTTIQLPPSISASSCLGDQPA